MGRQDFNRKQCIRALLKLGFVKDNKRRGSHDKFKAPEHVLQQRQANQPPFIMVPRSRQLHCQLEILKELWAFGGDAFVEEFLGHIK
ncbi:MAG: hypothetical protein UV82_C0002G0115 [Candidatus Magasanikbacteria bacterium GW2011_GWD2_43_18]|uniref:YcfA family protein n=1 Tax=Candidatus Magasanikbacteria bacterium GW2011_GWE2_42_7 TaxID=1619052 RepID=A0A0G1BIG8_9BACT|nr:MAG: hypothetical protein UV18_C0008G0043 [Candidatus Magasanikbacteria bacterium GW2011_GWC2_42_27]KKS73195.1 MAG: hypothetical protein UV42_C0001G0010 [Candidatus Magasanikbacteria bacterium GW2011_GWE2_42_7]KKT05145.1 MAG: hypothetical protein UV82_C0002G0115 [Candidatus Magasanikbacteria bacterium GW2011_GWD2_43_18]HBB38209.1 hypothetical protein [Candidatus Magasanikbacteria bacterium]HCC14038.1 hypothetical protein [Candidatus Magasanikbacteria bacterium]